MTFAYITLDIDPESYNEVDQKGVPYGKKRQVYKIEAYSRYTKPYLIR